MRQMLGLLSPGGQVRGARAPQPGLAGLEALVADARGAGLPVELIVDGARRALPTGVELAAYRVVEEALENAIRHSGPSPTTVRVRYDSEALDVEIADTGTRAGRADPGDRPGSGLVAMRERIRVFGGDLQTGRRRDGDGFRVHARLPLTSPGEPDT
jgi:signal transduction histidine kinase